VAKPTQDSKPKPPAAPPTYVKDAEGIAKAWGLKLYDPSRWKMLVKQLDAVRAAMKAPGFPPKIKSKGYERAAIMAFAMERVEVHKNLREFVVHENRIATDTPSAPRRQPAAGDLPEQSDPAGQDLFDAPESFEASLLLWKDKVVNPEKWLMSPIQQWQLKEVKKRWPELFEFPTNASGTTDAGVNIEGGLRGVANWIRNNYSGRLSRLPSHTDISNWTKGEYLPHGCRENFPASDANNSRYKTHAVTAWVEKYLVKADSAQALPMSVLDDRQRKEKADADMAEMAAEAQRKKLSGMYVLTETAERTATAIGIAVRTLTREALERALPKRFGDKLAARFPEQHAALKEELVADCVAVFTDWQRLAQARIEELLAQARQEN